MAISSAAHSLLPQLQQAPKSRSVLPNSGSRRIHQASSSSSSSSHQPLQQQQQQPLWPRVVPITRQGIHQSIRLHRKTLAEEHLQQQQQQPSRKLVSQVPARVSPTTTATATGAAKINLQQQQQRRLTSSLIKPTPLPSSTNSRLRQGALYARRQYHITTASTTPQSSKTTSSSTTTATTTRQTPSSLASTARHPVRSSRSSTLRAAESQQSLLISSSQQRLSSCSSRSNTSSCSSSSSSGGRGAKTASKFSLASSTSSLTLTVVKRAKASPTRRSTPVATSTSSPIKQRSSRCKAPAAHLVSSHRSVSSSALMATRTALKDSNAENTRREPTRNPNNTTFAADAQINTLVNNITCAATIKPDNQTTSGSNNISSRIRSDQPVAVSSSLELLAKKRLTLVGNTNSSKLPYIIGDKTQQQQQICASNNGQQTAVAAVNINPPDDGDDDADKATGSDCIYLQQASHTTHDFNMISEILICSNNTNSNDTDNADTTRVLHTSSGVGADIRSCDKMLRQLPSSSSIDNNNKASPLGLNSSRSINSNINGSKENVPPSESAFARTEFNAECQLDDNANKDNVKTNNDCHHRRRLRSVSSDLSDEQMVLGSPIVTPPPSDLDLDVEDGSIEPVPPTKASIEMRTPPPDIDITLKPIGDYYDLEPRPFARGKFAQVKRCVNKVSKQCFAAKCIKKRRRLVDIRHEILLEIEALKLSHYTSRIVKLYQVFETSTEMILILEMAQGGELQRVLDDEEVIEESIVKRMVGQILEALIELHANDIAHLDLKPQNLLLTSTFPDGDIKLCDFGISRRITKDCEIREICGTPDYVAPEILRYDPISLATDMWSLGVLTYVLLTGYSPFGSENKQQTFCNITQANLDFPSEIFDKISDEAIDFMRKLILREPGDRLTSIGAKSHCWLSH